MISVITLTYNRAKTLERCYDSLKRQNIEGFEWVIVDDGSTDNTDKVVDEWKKQDNVFEISYYKYSHIGHARVFNRAIQLAKGEYIMWCDSNKYIADNALYTITQKINEIEDNQRFAGISGMRASIKTGKIFGGIPYFRGKQYIDATNLERHKYNLGGTKAEVYKREILLQHLLPEIEGEMFCTEAVMFDAIASEGYKIRWYPDVWCYGDYASDGMTKSGLNSKNGHDDNYKGYIYYVCQALKFHKGLDALEIYKEYVDYQKGKNKCTKSYYHEVGLTLYRVIRLYVEAFVERVLNKIKTLRWSFK